jgi:hypothetical protein
MVFVRNIRSIPGIDPNTFKLWLDVSQPHEVIEYFVGPNLGISTLETVETAKLAREAFARGEVELVQRRTGKGFTYLAIKRRHVRVPILANGSRWHPQITTVTQTYG